MLYYNRKLKNRSRELRTNMTESELILWCKIRQKQINGAQFNRQKPIGNYIVDFYCQEYNLVIELDGSHHFTVEGKEYDSEKDEYLRGHGLKVLRFTNHQIMKNLNSVLNIIYKETSK
jgi:very-short-patch-repair endonuclease